MYVTLIVLISIFNCIHGNLYERDENILSFGHDILETIAFSNTSWIVQFYNSECPYCRSYSPTWRYFARRVEAWNYTLKVAAMDCFAGDNLPICQDFDITKTPCIKIYPPGCVSCPLVETVEERKLDELMLLLTKHLQKWQIIFPLPTVKANLTLYKSSRHDIFEIAPKGTKHCVLIQNKSDEVLSTILDLSSFKSLYARRIPLTGLKAKRGKALIIFRKQKFKNVFFPPKIGSLNLTFKILKNLKSKFEWKKWKKYLKSLSTARVTSEKKMDISHTMKINNGDMQHPVLSQIDKVYMVDLENTLNLAFNNEIAALKVLQGESLGALKDFVNVLVDFFPARPMVFNYLKKLSYFLNGLPSQSGLPSHSYLSKLKSFSSDISALPAVLPWKSCKGSANTFRGYTCGLWTLFHTLTVNAYLKSKDLEQYDPHRTLRTIHGYVKHFFNCRECSMHFQQMYAIDAESSVSVPKDEVRWLWAAHNKVNIRLKGDYTEDPHHPKQLFPPINACPACWMPDQKILIEEKSIDYIIKLYARENIFFDGTQGIRFSINLYSPDYSYNTVYCFLMITSFIMCICICHKYTKNYGWFKFS